MSKKLLAVLIIILVASAVFINACSNQPAQEQDKQDVTEKKEEVNYPEQPIKVVVPYNAGGGTDVLTRAVAKYIELEQPFVVTNVAGAGAKIGTMEVVNSKPDGYTILSHSKALVVGYHSGLFDVPIWRELEPIAAFVQEQNGFSVKKDAPWNTIEEFIEYAKKNPNKVKWGFAGIGGSTHASVAAFCKDVGIEVNYVPYNGAAESRAALAGGHVDIIVTQISEVIDMVKAGDFRMLATTGEERNPHTSDVPTLQERGIDHVFTMWRGFYAPKGTPEQVIKKLETAFKQASENPELKKFLEDMTFEVKFMDSEQVKRQLEEDAKALEPLAPALKAE